MKTKIMTATGMVLLLFMIAGTIQSCYQKYYKVSKASEKAVVNTDSTFLQQNKYIILRLGNYAYHMENIVLGSDKKSLSCKLGRIGPDHGAYLVPDRMERMKFKRSTESGVLNEVHVFVASEEFYAYDSTITLPFNHISKIEILEFDKGRTTTSTIVSTVGIVFGALLLVAGVSAIASGGNDEPPPPTPPPTGEGEGSCPYVSVYDGAGFVTQGELYAGSVYPQLARHDYLPLAMQPVSEGSYKLLISNEQQEVQNTDLAELMVITHDKHVQMMVDEQGRLYSISKPVTPIAATVENKSIHTNLSAEGDGLVYAFDDTAAYAHNTPVQLTFPLQPGVKTAKLILNLRNAAWIDFMFHKMTQGYGVYYAQFVERQHKKSASQLNNWIESQYIPFTVSILTRKGWQRISAIAAVGPVAFRKIIVPIDLDNISGDNLQVKLSTGFMFWELDYAAIDFTADAVCSVETILPSNAVDENGRDVTALLSTADAQYLVQPQPGNYTTVEYIYNKKVPEGKAQTFVLHSKGYYEYIRNYTNAPDVDFLKQFKHKGALSKYSMVLYKQVVQGDYSSFASK